MLIKATSGALAKCSEATAERAIASGSWERYEPKPKRKKPGPKPKPKTGGEADVVRDS